MERRFTFIIFVGGREYAAICDQYIKTREELRATKFGIWAAASKFKKSASVYVYEWEEEDGWWRLCDSMQAKFTDNKMNYLTDDYVTQLAKK